MNKNYPIYRSYHHYQRGDTLRLSVDGSEDLLAFVTKTTRGPFVSAVTLDARSIMVYENDYRHSFCVFQGDRTHLFEK
tara:strand:- start:12862 stop:13095 length:234 start_codon:yes stop_codon:yes gene_type:complete